MIVLSKSIRLLLCLITIFSLTFSPGAVQAAGPRQEDGPAQPTAGWTIRYHPGTTRAALLIPDRAYRPTLAAGESLTPEGAARSFLTAYGALFGLKDAQGELRLERSAASAAEGAHSLRFQQVFRPPADWDDTTPIPVLGAFLVAAIDASGAVTSVNGEALPTPAIDAPPAIDAAQAQRLALRAAVRWSNLPQDALHASAAQLVVYAPELLDAPGFSSPRLAWQMQITGGPSDPVREFVLVDARLGSIALHFSQLDQVKERIVFDHNNTTGKDLPGVNPVRVEGGSPVGISDANYAYDYSGFTYDFYATMHGRDSIDNRGMKLVSTTRYCPSSASCPYRNAFWNGAQMVYGDGFAVGDDVVAHELTHGVTEFESGLLYFRQSGAINEALSDIWGELVDQAYTNGLDDDSLGVKWLMGEDLSIGAIRSMSNPTLFEQPDSTSNWYYECGMDDNGGVHTNSGVVNKAAYLMTDGGLFNGVTVLPLGSAKVARLFYEVQTNLLTPAAGFADLANSLDVACSRLVGRFGITVADCTQVDHAIEAVQMRQAPSCAPSPAPLCDSGEQPFDLFSDTFEYPLSGQWSAGSNWYNPQNNNPYAFDPHAGFGNYNLWGYDYYQIADSIIQMAPSIALPDNGDDVYLRFDHQYEFDTYGATYYDGGVLEYSQDGMAWKDAAPFFDTNGYTGSLSAGYGNPLGGRPAFAGSSYGMTSTRLNLNAMRGSGVRFRFRIGSDSEVDGLGWLIDDVRLYTCRASGLSSTFVPIARKAASSASTVFHDSFSDAYTGLWTPISGAWSGTPLFYRVYGLDKAWVSSALPQGISNGTMEVRMRRYGVCKTCSTSVFLRGAPAPLSSTNDWANGYTFQYTNGGSVSVYKKINGKLTALLGWTSSSAIVKNDWNVIKVVASGNALAFYINGTLIWAANDTSITSPGLVGVGMYSSSTTDRLDIDWVSVNAVP